MIICLRSGFKTPREVSPRGCEGDAHSITFLPTHTIKVRSVAHEHRVSLSHRSERCAMGGPATRAAPAQVAPGRPRIETDEPPPRHQWLFYVNKTGCQWQMMQKDLGNGHTIYGYFRHWRREGSWAWVMDAR